jgi:hypothetical protein
MEMSPNLSGGLDQYESSLGEISTIVAVAENHMTENVMPLIDDMLSSKLTELATVSSSSKVKSRQEEEAAAQKEILRHFDLRYAEYIRAAQTIHQLKVNIAALTAKLNENMLVSASQDMDGKDLKDIIGAPAPAPTAAPATAAAVLAG